MMQTVLSNRFRSLLVFALLGIFQATAWAQADSYPNRPIKLIITWPVGGFADTLGRTVANQLSTILGQQVVVENRGGANGMIGADAVAKAAPDGYTLMFQSVTSHAINPTMYGKTPYSTEKDIIPLAVVASVPMLLVVNPNLPAKNIAELIELTSSHFSGQREQTSSSSQARWSESQHHQRSALDDEGWQITGDKDGWWAWP
jgi:tripartite-type tricarboxylate transporter receptor subunit TctC